MLKMKNNIHQVILKYFLIFSLSILALLWLFQILFFNSFYRIQKINDIKMVANEISKKENSSNFVKDINNLAFNKSVCIEIINNNYDIIYGSTYFGKGCISGIEKTYQYKYDFISKNKTTETYEIKNPDFHNNTVIQALKLHNNHYAFINTSIEPVDSIISLIHKQLIVITIITLFLSYILAYFIASHLAKPIKEINTEAKKLAKGNYTANFNNHNEILEIKELSNTLNYTKEELKKTEEYRRDLMANVSHDLKTPLTMIKAYAEIAEDLHQNNKEKQKQDLETIIEETDRLTILVNDILELSKMESIEEDLQYQSFDLIELINNILKRYEILKETEKYNFNFIHKEKEIIIKADQKRIEQVIYNLLNNAVNYTGKDNQITIIVTENENIKVEIKDTGKGIKEKDIPYIWDKYYKNKKEHKRNLIGTGLGLSIVKKILEKHNYKYGVKTKKNQGTTFYFEIPKKED